MAPSRSATASMLATVPTAAPDRRRLYTIGPHTGMGTETGRQVAPSRSTHRPGQAGRPRVVIVDENTVIRTGLPLLMPEFAFIASFSDCETLLGRRPTADVVLLDVPLAGTGRIGARGGVDTVRACVQVGYRVCLYTDERRRHLLLRCLQAGAQGVVRKADPAETLSAALFQVAAGAVVITTGLIGLAELAERRAQLPTMTERQRQVLAGRARGEAFRSIARRLSITERTAQEHWGEVTKKFATYLRTHSAADLERLLGLDNGALFPPEDDGAWW